MVKFNSSLGTQTFESTEDPRSFLVDDMSGAEEAPPQRPRQQQRRPQFQEVASTRDMSADEVMALRNQRIAEARGISAESRQRLEILLGIGRATKNVTVEAETGTVTYSLRTLKGREQKHVVSLAEQADKLKTVEATFPIRNTTLAYALYAVDNIDLDLYLGTTGSPMEDRLATRLAFIEEMDDHLIRYLYDQHQELVKENLVRFQSPEDVKEVAEQIKKSGGESGT